MYFFPVNDDITSYKNFLDESRVVCGFIILAYDAIMYVAIGGFVVYYC